LWIPLTASRARRRRVRAAHEVETGRARRFHRYGARHHRFVEAPIVYQGQPLDVGTSIGWMRENDGAFPAPGSGTARVRTLRTQLGRG
jgi:hypothetical protein